MFASPLALIVIQIKPSSNLSLPRKFSEKCGDTKAKTFSIYDLFEIFFIPNNFQRKAALAVFIANKKKPSLFFFIFIIVLLMSHNIFRPNLLKQLTVFGKELLLQ